jgi:hypothetical protein
MNTPSIGDSAYLTYQQLEHPAVLDGATYVEANHAMLDIVASCSYANKPWVVALFADGSKWAYYDGDLVGAFRNGVVLAGREDVDDVAHHVYDCLVAEDLLNVNVAAPATPIYNANARYIDLTPINENVGLAAEVSVERVTGSTAVIRHSVGSPTIEVTGALAIGEITITFGQPGSSIRSIKIQDVDETWVELLEPSVGFEWADGAGYEPIKTIPDLAAVLNEAFATCDNENFRNFMAVVAIPPGSNVARSIYIYAPADKSVDMNGHNITCQIEGPLIMGVALATAHYGSSSGYLVVNQVVVSGINLFAPIGEAVHRIAVTSSFGPSLAAILNAQPCPAQWDLTHDRTAYSAAELAQHDAFNSATLRVVYIPATETFYIGMSCPTTASTTPWVYDVGVQFICTEYSDAALCGYVTAIKDESTGAGEKQQLTLQLNTYVAHMTYQEGLYTAPFEIIATAAGGTAPYNYHWKVEWQNQPADILPCKLEVVPGATNKILIVPAQGFRVSVCSAGFTVTVTDFAGTSVTQWFWAYVKRTFARWNE